jgi:hypothetical protein
VSCPHPRDPIERIVGPKTLLVCPDCNTRLGSDEPYDTVEAEAFGLDSPEATRDAALEDILFCAFETEDAFCIAEPDHEGDHELVPFAADPVEPEPDAESDAE